MEILINPKNFRNFFEIKDSIPDKPGIYCIKINKPNSLPKFQKQIKKREKILYIGIASKSLRKRLNQELNGNGHGTFFRSIGSMLGCLPPKGSLKRKANKNNYKFSDKDRLKIVKWIKSNLKINFITRNNKVIKKTEKKLIKKYKPLVNIAHNPESIKIIKELRKKARGYANK